MKYLIILLFVAGCAHKQNGLPDSSYLYLADLCFKEMAAKDIPIDFDMDEMIDKKDRGELSEYRYGWDMGYSAGYFHGCMGLY